MIFLHDGLTSMQLKLRRVAEPCDFRDVKTPGSVQIAPKTLGNMESHHGRHSIADLVVAAGFIALKFKLIWKTLQACTLTHGQASAPTVRQIHAVHVTRGSCQITAS